jgi:hypothetical protein
MRTSRNYDGTPETPRQTRFYDLRESGYRGPINQDGYQVTSGPEADILRALAQARGVPAGPGLPTISKPVRRQPW